MIKRMRKQTYINVLREMRTHDLGIEGLQERPLGSGERKFKQEVIP
jgi:hypothetical protein